MVREAVCVNTDRYDFSVIPGDAVQLGCLKKKEVGSVWVGTQHQEYLRRHQRPEAGANVLVCLNS